MSRTLPWPAPADSAAANRLIERFIDLGAEQAAYAATPGGAALLAAIGGGSPFLSDLAIREHPTVGRFVTAVRTPRWPRRCTT